MFSDNWPHSQFPEHFTRPFQVFPTTLVLLMPLQSTTLRLTCFIISLENGIRLKIQCSAALADTARFLLRPVLQTVTSSAAVTIG